MLTAPRAAPSTARSGPRGRTSPRPSRGRATPPACLPSGPQVLVTSLVQLNRQSRPLFRPSRRSRPCWCARRRLKPRRAAEPAEAPRAGQASFGPHGPLASWRPGGQPDLFGAPPKSPAALLPPYYPASTPSGGGYGGPATAAGYYGDAARGMPPGDMYGPVRAYAVRAYA